MIILSEEQKAQATIVHENIENGMKFCEERQNFDRYSHAVEAIKGQIENVRERMNLSKKEGDSLLNANLKKAKATLKINLKQTKQLRRLSQKQIRALEKQGVQEVEAFCEPSYHY